MAPVAYSAMELFDALVEKEDFLLLDVRNETEFGRFKVEGPYPVDMLNVPYMEVIEHEEQSVAKVPVGKKIRIVCAKEGSAKYVGDILARHGHEEIGYLIGGINSWGNLLAPVTVVSNDSYELVQFRRPGKASLNYGLISGKEMMLFDPAKNIEAYQAYAHEKGCAIINTFETHRQADYISGSQPLNKATGARILAPADDFEGAAFGYTPVADGARYGFTAGGPEVRVIHTPGHTPGSTCYLIDEQFLIAGDTVFIFSIGRPDLGGKAAEWSELLFDTMRNIINPMDAAVMVMPGHYMDWQEADQKLVFAAPMGKVRDINREIYDIDDPDRFYRFIESNMRPQPEEYAKIREINAGLVEVDMEKQDILDLGKNECAASMMKAS